MQAMALDNFFEVLESQYPVVLSGEQTYNSIHLDLIFVREDLRGQGIGTEVMDRIIAYAEMHRLPVELTPSKQFGGNVRKLRKFYKRFGFRKNKNPLYAMIRPVEY